MNHRDDRNEENQRVLEELEALQQRRLLAYRANATAAMQSAGLGGIGIQPPLHHRLNMYGVPAVSTLSTGILDPLTATINAQQMLIGSRTAAGFSDISRMGMLGRGLGIQPTLSAPSVPMIGFNPLHALPVSAYHHRSLLERSQQLLPSQPQNDAGAAAVEASASRASLGISDAQRVERSQQLISSSRPQNDTGAPAAVPSASTTSRVLRASLAIADVQREDTRGDQDGLPQVVFAECDEKHLSEYQCLLRQQIEFYASKRRDMKWNIQGRNKAIVKGQVGLRCKWCAHMPIHRRAPGAVYYSSNLDGLYQAAQNMAKNHFCKDCNHIPASVKKKLTQLRDSRRRAPGGKRYWAEGARAIGIYECDGGLRFRGKAASTSSEEVTSSEPR